MKHSNHYLFAIVEDIDEVREAIALRMDRYNGWNCICNTAYYHEASENIRKFKPHLLFLDYSILGGNAFMLLNEIDSMEDYNPYIVFFTAYMSDQPEIAEQLLNRYALSVKVFLNKPIFQKLDQRLESILSETIIHHYQQPITSSFWINSTNNQKIQLVPRNITCFSQAPNPRNKIIHITSNIQHEIRATWKFCEQITSDYNLNFEYANTRLYLVNVEKITSMKRPHIWLNNDLKVVVTKERWISFIQRMENLKS